MIVAARYSFNGGAEYVNEKYPHLLKEIETAIGAVDASKCKTKASKEKTMVGKLLYAPRLLNKEFKSAFKDLHEWKAHRENCLYSDQHYTENYQKNSKKLVGFREMDFVKEKLGVEVQFGKYSFMVYNVAAKMTIFRNLDVIDAGVEIVPVKQLAGQMSTGVSYFEQFVWDLDQRGVSNIDVPVLILGIDLDGSPSVAANDLTQVQTDADGTDLAIDEDAEDDDFDEESDDETDRDNATYMSDLMGRDD